MGAQFLYKMVRQIVRLQDAALDVVAAGPAHSKELPALDVVYLPPHQVDHRGANPLHQADALTDFLDEIAQRCRFRYQFFGHYHTNKVIREKFVLLYEQIIKLKL